ncbi:MAG: hypothetical protein JHD02_02610 [Thermoleophilaceae bacterium]|nr:hypothetical protein [Thermoleophilaceae bacterium]
MSASLAVALSNAQQPGREAAFIVLLGFVGSFLFIRTSARLMRAQVSWWPGSVRTDSGVHLHHLVWGVSLLIVTGFLGYAMEPVTPWYQLTALLFGVGCGLTLDEFALWVHLDDVYWTHEGRISLDAVALVVAFMGLVVIGLRPFGLTSGTPATVEISAAFLVLSLAVISILKGRIAHGVVTIFIPFFGLWATCRLAKPNSPWARRFYHEEMIARSAERYPPDSRTVRWRRAAFNAIGGRINAHDAKQ